MEPSEIHRLSAALGKLKRHYEEMQAGKDPNWLMIDAVRSYTEELVKILQPIDPEVTLRTTEHVVMVRVVGADRPAFDKQRVETEIAAIERTLEHPAFLAPPPKRRRKR